MFGDYMNNFSMTTGVFIKIKSIFFLLFILMCTQEKGSPLSQPPVAYYRTVKLDTNTYVIVDTIDVLTYQSKPYGGNPYTYTIPVFQLSVVSLDSTTFTACESDGNGICINKLTDTGGTLFLKGITGQGKTYTDTIQCYFSDKNEPLFKSGYFTQLLTK